MKNNEKPKETMLTWEERIKANTINPFAPDEDMVIRTIPTWRQRARQESVQPYWRSC